MRSAEARRTDRGLDLVADAGLIVEKTITSLVVRFGATFSQRDREDLAQEAYVRILEHRDRGHEIRAPLAAVKKTARNLGFDRLNRARLERPEDPTSERFSVAASSVSAERRFAARVDLARAVEAVSGLPAAQQAVYRALVVEGLTPATARRRLGMPESTFFKYRKHAFDRVCAALAGNEDSDAARDRAALLAAFEFGSATSEERARVRRLMSVDPSVRPQLVAIRRNHRAVASTLPVPAADGTIGDSADSVLQQIAAALGRARDALTGLGPRGGAEVGETTAALATSGAGRGAGALGAGLLAKVGALGGGTQAAIACLAGGAALTTCLATGILPSTSSSSGDDDRERARSERTVDPRLSRPAAAAAVLPSQVGSFESAPTLQPVARERGSSDGEEDAQAAAPEPVLEESAPPVQQEFTPDAAGVPLTGAPADTNDSNGASAETVREEFGP